MYTGSNTGRNGLAVVVSQKHIDNIIEVKRINDHIIFLAVLASVTSLISTKKSVFDGSDT